MSTTRARNTLNTVNIAIVEEKMEQIDNKYDVLISAIDVDVAELQKYTEILNKESGIIGDVCNKAVETINKLVEDIDNLKSNFKWQQSWTGDRVTINEKEIAKIKKFIKSMPDGHSFNMAKCTPFMQLLDSDEESDNNTKNTNSNNTNTNNKPKFISDNESQQY
eukprot:230778_1